MVASSPSYEGHYTASDWQTFVGLFWVVIVVTLGARTVEAAIQATFAFVLFQKRVLSVWIPYLLNHIQPFHTFAQVPTPVQFMLFGLGAITYARHPEGIIEYSKRRSERDDGRFRRGRGSGDAESRTGRPITRRRAGLTERIRSSRRVSDLRSEAHATRNTVKPSLKSGERELSSSALASASIASTSVLVRPRWMQRLVRPIATVAAPASSTTSASTALSRVAFWHGAMRSSPHPPPHAR